MNSNYQDLNPVQTLDINRYIQQANTCFTQGDIEGAKANFQDAISLYPNSVKLYTERAKFRRHKLGDLRGALEDYTEAICINPQNSFFYFWRSQTYQALGNQQKAIEDYNTAMNLAPDGTMHHFS
ncbi:MAG: tetratricopeptide repeat protein [Nostocales cyanobacterium LE14-WE4]|nr:tetratricopeptide repeat protein [Nostocales cyanobacterium LE14-WE4]